MHKIGPRLFSPQNGKNDQLLFPEISVHRITAFEYLSYDFLIRPHDSCTLLTPLKAFCFPIIRFSLAAVDTQYVCMTYHDVVFNIPKWDIGHRASRQIDVQVLCLNGKKKAQMWDHQHNPNTMSSTFNCSELLWDWSAWPWINSVHYSNQRVETHRQEGPNIDST